MAADSYLTTEPWPFPGHSREERAQHIARAYRELVFDITQGRCTDPAGDLHRLDMTWRRYGIHWHMPTIAPPLDPHEWVNARDAAHYADRAEATIRTWAHRGHIETRVGRDGSTQYLLGSLMASQPGNDNDAPSSRKANHDVSWHTFDLYHYVRNRS